MRDGETGGKVLSVERGSDRALEGEEGAEERALTVVQLEHDPKWLGRQLTQLFPSLTHEHRMHRPFRLQAQQLRIFKHSFGRVSSK